ncbi:MAG: HAMP domain-containing protein, partial [Candidatus Eiseniibacteriota bacterium]
MLHLGLAALLLAVAVWGLRRRSGRGPASLVLSVLAIAAAAAELGLAARRAQLARDWEALAESELEARATRIVEFLRDEGSSALAAIRATGGDADTRALLSSEGALVRTARRPVFLDLMERFPGREAGVTVYDAAGFPRAWSGWSATATMSLSEKPSPEAEIVEIREGNIYTILQVTHPVVAASGAVSAEAGSQGNQVGPAADSAKEPLGWVVYQRPLRVQFPLENRFLRVDDVLRRLEGGSGVRADLAFALSLRGEDDVARIRPGALKLDVREESASAAAAIVSAGDEPVGRVTLSGLSQGALIAERLGGLLRVRAWLLLTTGFLAAALIWLAVAERSVWRTVVRIAVIAAARFALSHGAPWSESGFLGVFDPSVYALNRFGGLARSPGDLALTAAALVLVGRELRSLVGAHQASLAAFGRRFPLVAWIPAVAAALLVGSCAGFHWSRTVSVARDANVPLYAGLDPFASAPAAALELALLLGGAAFLLFGDALVRASVAFLDRWPARSGVLVAWGLAAFGSAVKIGAAADEASLGGPASSFDSDLVRTVATIAALLAFHRLASRWERPRAAAVFVVAFLAQLAGFTAIAESTEIRRRGLVELLAQDHVESPSSYRQFLIGSVIGHLSSSLPAKEVLAEGAGPEHANLAFVLWGKSPLASVSAGCRFRILDALGRTVSTFSLGFPPELATVAEAPEPGETGESGAVRYRREEVGSVRVDLYTGAAPITSDGRVLGAVEVAMAWFDDLRGTGPALASVFTNLTAPDELLGFVREVPDRIDRYRGETLVYSTDPEGGLGKRVPEFLVQALADTRSSGRWVERKIDDKLYDLYCVRERDGEVTVGYLTFGIERMGPLSAAGLFVRSQLVALVLTLFALLVLAALARVLPAGRAGRFQPPRIGFRERVIGGFLIVALLPTVFLGFAGRKLFVEEQLQEFHRRLEEDLRLSGELLGRRLADAGRNAAGSREVIECLADPAGYRTLSAPLSVTGVVVVSEEGRLLGASRTADLGMAVVPGHLAASDTPVEFFRRRGEELYSCALVPVPADPAAGRARGGSVLAFQRVDTLLAADLERRVGSAVSFFAGGLLTATSKPELYQSEILSDLAEPTAYLKIELEGARRTLVESRVGSTSFLAAYAPLLDEAGAAVGILSTLAAFRGQGLGVEAGRVLSAIYFVCLAVLAGAVAAAVLLANRLTRPISDLTRGAERIGAGGLGHVILTKAGGEIGALVRSFNS